MRHDWTPEQRRELGWLVKKMPLVDVADYLGLSHSAVRSAVGRYGFGQSRRYTERELEFVKANHGKMDGREIAKELGIPLGKVHRITQRLGIGRKFASFGEDFEKFVREKNALGWSDTEIAVKWKCDRHAVSRRRQLMKLPNQAFSQRQREKTAEKTREQCRKAGVKSLAEVRRQAFRKYARKYGWPEDLRPRAVQILQALLIHGPMIRREIAEKIGMPWKGVKKSLVSNDPEGTYLHALVKRGLVICMRRIVRAGGQGQNVSLYSLNPFIERGPQHVEGKEHDVDQSGGLPRPAPVGAGDEASGEGGPGRKRRGRHRQGAGRPRKAGRPGGDQVRVRSAARRK